MSTRFGALLMLLSSLAWSQDKGARTFQLELPEGWKSAKALVLVFQDVEVPAGRGVVFRLFPPGAGAAENLGALAIPAKSPTAKGIQQFPKLEMNLSDVFRRWLEAQNGSRVSITVKPYAGLREAPDLIWQVKDLHLQLRN